MKRLLTISFPILILVGCTSKVSERPAPAKAAAKRVFFVEPKDGAKVKSPVQVKFGVEGVDVVPAGERPGDDKAGHHHVIVDGKSVEKGVMVPMDTKNVHHYGKGQTEATLELSPGKHTLTMQFADAAHLSYGEKMSATITIEVEE